MFNNSVAIGAKQIKQLKRDVRDAQGKLAATAEWRTVRQGYTLDEGHEAYRLASSDFVQSNSRLTEVQQQKIKLDLTKRKPVDQLIDWLTNRF